MCNLNQQGIYTVWHQFVHSETVSLLKKKIQKQYMPGSQACWCQVNQAPPFAGACYWLVANKVSGDGWLACRRSAPTAGTVTNQPVYFRRQGRRPTKQ